MADRLHLAPKHRRVLEELFREHLPDVEVWAYGSRVSGKSHDGSDLDLVLRGPGLKEIPLGQLGDFEEAMRESTVPFLVEARDWARLPERFHGEIEQDYVALVENTLGNLRNPQVKCLGEIADIVMGQSPSGDSVSDCNGIPLLNGPTEFGPHHPTPVQFTTNPKKFSKIGDVLFCVRGSTTGRMNWADQKYAIGRGVAAIRHKHEISLQPFVRAVIESGLPDLLSQATGSTFPNVSAQQLASIPCPDIDRDEQRGIAHLLGALDDKIELNRRINETLEAKARTLFKSWFVDFDPVHAKMASCDTGLPQSRADLIPDRLVGSEIGEIPEGWTIYQLNDLAVHHTESVTPASQPEVQFEHFSIPAYDRGQTPKIERGREIKSNKIVVPSNSVLLSKLNPEILRVWMPGLEVAGPQICSTEFLVFTPRRPASRSLLFSLFTNGTFRTLLQSMVTGTSKSHQRVPPKSLRRRDILSGKISVFEKFDEIVAPMLERVVVRRVEAHTLASLRDALLPRLISGEIRLNDAERHVEAAL
ncbi:MAG: restriction endonuclease subunit S [Rhodospirillaceae bacterium]|nr:restriction endonuclease subunit S [Rhodospirillaceae bacterium]